MGGMIVQEIAKIAGDKIAKLICFATSSIGEIPGRFETMDESIRRLKEEGINELKTRIPPKWFVKGNKDKNYFFCENAVTNISEETASNALHAMKQWNGFENLKNIKNQTLIIWGDKDTAYNLEQVETLNKNIPNSELKIINGCSHNAHLEEPDKINQIINEFLSN
jgi:pimeloyl-ACP methyl ester carboxylesterase